MPVEAIHLGAAGTPELWEVQSVRAVAGKGLEGDRLRGRRGREDLGGSRSG